MQTVRFLPEAGVRFHFGTILQNPAVLSEHGDLRFPVADTLLSTNSRHSPRIQRGCCFSIAYSAFSFFALVNHGSLDIYFVNEAGIPGFDKSNRRFYNRLYRNNVDETFRDVTDSAGLRGAGYDMGVAVGDYDNDGYEDVFVAGVNRNQLFHNNGYGTLPASPPGRGSKVPSSRGKTWSMSAGWFDYVVILNYVHWSS